VIAFVCLYLLFLPPPFLIDPEIDAAPETDYTADDPAFATEQPGKHPPFEHADIAYSFSLMLALEIAAATV
jgi:hypothetical protein